MQVAGVALVVPLRGDRGVGLPQPRVSAVDHIVKRTHGAAVGDTCGLPAPGVGGAVEGDGGVEE